MRDLTKLTEVSEFEKRAIVRFVFPLFGLGRGKEKRENQYLRKLANGIPVQVVIAIQTGFFGLLKLARVND